MESMMNPSVPPLPNTTVAPPPPMQQAEVCVLYGVPPPCGAIIDMSGAPPPPHILAPAVLVDHLGNATAFVAADPYGTAAAFAAASFAVAPGAEHSANKQLHNMQNQQQMPIAPNQNADPNKKIVMDYESDFPTLAPTQNQSQTAQQPAWNAKSNKTMPVRATTVTQVFHFPAEERRFSSHDHGFGEKNQEQDECNAIMQKTETNIDLCLNKDSSLTIVVSGKRAHVEEARKLIVQSLQTQCHREIRIPKDHHRVLIGREGKKLQELEKSTDCRIMIPGRETTSEMIKIVGPREGIEKAIHQIQLISDEQSKMAQEHLTIPKVYYAWIRGPHNETYDRISQETGVRINIPPPTAASDIIVITGEKEGVHKAVALVKKIYDENKNSQTVSIKLEKTQHRFVIGPQRSGLAEILKETDVSVEVPPEDSDNNEITLRGDANKLAAALAKVYAKANSVKTAEVKCPVWLHKYIIGPRGSGIRSIVGEDHNGSKPQVQVSFEEEGRIFLEGPPAEVKTVKDKLSSIVADLQANYTFEILHISPLFHRHIIGKSGANITKLRQETGVTISIPSDDSHSDEVRVEGRREGVTQAKTEIMDMVKKMENEKSRDIIIENRFHRIIIGTKGESVRDLRDKYPGVNLAFPEPGRKTDIVTLRGPKDEVDKCYKHLQNVVKDLKESNYQERVHIFKEFYPHIIGKGGANIKRIREETDTKIDLPAESGATDAITITGKKANVEKARDMLRKLESELSSVISVDINIPHKLHASLIGGGGRLIQHISQTECGGVLIKFPGEKSQSDKVTIRGHKEGVEKAKRMLQDLAKDRELTGHTAEVKAKSELFRYLIGRGGSKIHKLREDNPHVKIMLPRHDDPDQETIHLMGKKEDVEVAKDHLTKIIHELSQLVEIHVDIDPKWHRHFIGRGAGVLHEVQDQCGGVMVSFPKQGTNSTSVVIKGGKDPVESAKKRLIEIVDDLESQVTITVHVPQRHYGSLLANRGQKIQEITQRCNVQIKFPERAGGSGRSTTTDNQSPRLNGHHLTNGSAGTGSTGGDESPSSPAHTATESPLDMSPTHPLSSPSDDHDLIRITGRLERCEEAKELLIAEIPVTETINVPFDFHRMMIGRNGQEIRRLMDQFGVNVRIPPQEQHLDEIFVSGPPSRVQEAVKAIMLKVEELEEEAKDRELKSHQAIAKVPTMYHPKLIGPKGAEINRIRQKFDVQITIPAKTNENASPEDIIITGYEKNAIECKEEIERIISELQSLYVQDFTLDARVHSRIIGQKGKNIRKVMDDYNVEIRFPRSTDPDPNLITISGKSEDIVFDCIDFLRNLEEEYIQDISDRHRDPQRGSGEGMGRTNGYHAAGPDVEFVGRTPWEPPAQAVPDVTDMTDFPSMGPGEHAAGAKMQGGGSKWGPAATRGY